MANIANSDFDLAYEKYVATKASVENSPIREKGKDIFEWLGEDKEILKETEDAMKSAGYL